jgi:outer membrane protein assembly factor BamB
VAGSEGGTVHLLDGDGRFLWRTALGARVNEVCPNRAWDRFAVATDRGLVVLYRDGKKLVEFPTPGRALQVKLADDGMFVGLFHGRTEPRPELEKAVNLKTGGRSTVLIACFEPDGKMRWQAESPGFGEYKTEEAEELASALSGHGFQSIDMTPDGRRIVAGSTNYSVYAFEPSRGKVLWSTEPVDESARTLRISDDGDTVAFCGGGGLVCCDGKGRRLWHYRTPFSGYACDISSDGQRISVAAATGVVYVLDRGKTVVTRSPVHTVEPMVTALSPNGRYTAVGAVGYDLLLLKNP